MTTTQLRSILDYIGENKVEDIVEGARGIHDAMKILEGTKGVDAVKRPIVGALHASDETILGYSRIKTPL
jgi:hypothetical protein